MLYKTNALSLHAKTYKGMEIEDILNKRAIDVTVDELATVIAAKLSKVEQTQQKGRVLSGIPGIMAIAQCSRSKASRLRNSGVLDDAITVVGRGFLIDEDKAMNILRNPQSNRKYIKGLH